MSLGVGPMSLGMGLMSLGVVSWSGADVSWSGWCLVCISLEMLSKGTTVVVLRLLAYGFTWRKMDVFCVYYFLTQ